MPVLSGTVFIFVSFLSLGPSLLRLQEFLRVPRCKLPLPELEGAGRLQAEHDARRARWRREVAAHQARNQQRQAQRARGEEAGSDSDSVGPFELFEASDVSEEVP